MKIPVIALAGPTASGKTALAVALAKRFGGEVVSADSMQIYKGLDIGTAKPCEEEKDGVLHHMIDICDINENFSVVDYCKRAHECIKAIHSRGHIPIVAGGTGLYLDSLVYDASYSSVGEDVKLRSELMSLAEKEGNLALHKVLENLDAVAAKELHPNNVKRVIRAIEIVKTTGKSLAQSVEKHDRTSSRYDVLYLVLTHEREQLYSRIEKRVDNMLGEGLYEEALWLYDNIRDKNATSMQAIGYKEFWPVIEGTQSLEEATRQLKQDTRRYAKRQLTWFRRHDEAILIDASKENAVLAAQRAVTLFLDKR